MDHLQHAGSDLMGKGIYFSFISFDTFMMDAERRERGLFSLSKENRLQFPLPAHSPPHVRGYPRFVQKMDWSDCSYCAPPQINHRGYFAHVTIAPDQPDYMNIIVTF